MVSYGRGTRGECGEARRSALPNGRAHRDAENQEAAHGGLRGGRVSLSGEGAAGGLATAGFVQRGGASRSRRIHVVDSSRGSRGAYEATRGAGQAAGIYGQSAGRAEPLEHEAVHGMAAAGAETCGRGGVRSFHGRKVSARDEIRALAAGESAAGLHDEAGGAGEPLGAEVAVRSTGVCRSYLLRQGSALADEDAMAAHEDAGENERDGDQAYERP